jgi:hypothetical protein
MLFDLRSRGRRRTVQVVYLGLALLFLLGFVGFGVGVGGGGGGLFNAFTEGGGSNSASFAARVASAEKRTHQHPTEPAAWQALVEAQFHQAGEPGNIATSGETETYTAQGKAVLAKVSRSWNTYLKLEPHHPDSELAARISAIYGEQGLNKPDEEVRALQIAVKGDPTVRLYSALAVAAYKARNLPVGDAAARRTVSLVPASERTKVKKYLAELRANPLAHSTSTISRASNGQLVATAGGKTYTVRPNGKGGYVAVGAKKGSSGAAAKTGTASTQTTGNVFGQTGTAKK